MLQLYKSRVVYSLLFAAICLTAETASAQVPSLRGHYHRRDGLFHTERMRWGGGLTTQGAGVLTHLIDVGGPIAAGFIGRDATNNQDSNTPRAATRPEWSDDYLKEQRRANDLLYRTAKLVGYDDGPGPSVQPIQNDRSLRPLSEVLKEYGDDPWNKKN